MLLTIGGSHCSLESPLTVSIHCIHPTLVNFQTFSIHLGFFVASDRKLRFICLNWGVIIPKHTNNGAFTYICHQNHRCVYLHVRPKLPKYRSINSPLARRLTPLNMNEWSLKRRGHFNRKSIVFQPLFFWEHVNNGDIYLISTGFTIVFVVCVFDNF